MMQLYNLLEEKWIPVARRSGKKLFIAPYEVVSDYERDPIVRLDAPRPDFNGALIQFLIGLIQTTFAPKDTREWRKYRDKQPSEDELRSAFEPFKFAFNLNGEGPRFMQDLDRQWASGSKALPINRLLIDEPFEQSEKLNKDFFVKRPSADAPKKFSPQAAAMALLSLNLNAPAGGQGHRTSARGGGPLTTIIKDETLWLDIWLNVLELDVFQLEASPGKADSKLIFPWCVQTKESSDNEKLEPIECHPFHIYWAMPRRIVLEHRTGNGPCSVFNAITTDVYYSGYFTKNYGNNYSENWVHPLTPYTRLPKQETLASKKTPDGGIGFRHWVGLTLSKQKNHPAKVISRFYNLGVHAKRISCFGYSMDNMKPLQWVQSILPLYEVKEEELEWYSIQLLQLVEIADKARGFLTFAAGLLSEGMGRELARDLNNALEPKFYEISATLASQGVAQAHIVKREWLELQFQFAQRIFDDFFLAGDWAGIDYGKVFQARSALKATFFKNRSKLEKLLELPSIGAPILSKQKSLKLNSNESV